MGNLQKEKYFFQCYKTFRQFCFNLEPKVKGMFLLSIYKFFYSITMSAGRERGSNKLLHKEALPKGLNPKSFTECF